MTRKILVINGHGEKKPAKINIQNKHIVITPGDANDDYVVSFDNMKRHLEEMTYQGKIWPIYSKGAQIIWMSYKDTQISDISISPLQEDFDFDHFAGSLLNKTNTWSKLTTPEHDVLLRGALAIFDVNDQRCILENQELEDYLRHIPAGSRPIFFCDKELGKVKPMGDTSLSDIYNAIALIKEFQQSGTGVIVATCSPSTGISKRIKVITQNPAMEIIDVLPDLNDIPVGVDLTKENEAIIAKAGILVARFSGVKVIPRYMHYIPGNDSHNLKQPIESIQFEFPNVVDRDHYKNCIKTIDKSAVLYVGTGITVNQPIIQLSPQFIAAFQQQSILSCLREKTGLDWKIDIDKVQEPYVEETWYANNEQEAETAFLQQFGMQSLPVITKITAAGASSQKFKIRCVFSDPTAIFHLRSTEPKELLDSPTYLNMSVIEQTNDRLKLQFSDNIQYQIDFILNSARININIASHKENPITETCLHFLSVLNLTLRNKSALNGDALRIILSGISTAPVAARDAILSALQRVNPVASKAICSELIEQAKKITHYAHASMQSTRSHAFEAKIKGDFGKDYLALKGDALKTAILLNFKLKLNVSKSTDELKNIVDGLKLTEEYSIIKKGQGITTRFFNLRTDSAIAFEKMVSEVSAKLHLQTTPFKP